MWYPVPYILITTQLGFFFPLLVSWYFCNFRVMNSELEEYDYHQSLNMCKIEFLKIFLS